MNISRRGLLGGAAAGALVSTAHAQTLGVCGFPANSALCGIPFNQVPAIGFYQGTTVSNLCSASSMLGRFVGFGMDFVAFGDWAAVALENTYVIPAWQGAGPRLTLSVPLAVGIGITSLTWSSTAGGTVAVVLRSPSNYVLNDTINIRGATNSGSGGDAAINITATINGFTDSQHFTFLLSAGAGVIGTIGTPSGCWLGNTLAQIAAGTATKVGSVVSTTDAYFTGLGTALVAAGLQNTIIRLGWEMNSPGFSPWYPDGSAGNAKSDMIAAWDHVVTLLRAVTGAQFLMMWCPSLPEINGDPTPNFYPTNTNVDIIAGDLYFKNFMQGNTDPPSVWLNEMVGFDVTGGGSLPANTNAYALAWLKNFAGLNNKPLAIGETGSGTGNHGMGDSAYFVQQLYGWSVANGVLLIAGWWDTTSNGFNGRVSNASNVTGVIPSGPNNTQMAAALRAAFGGPGVSRLYTGPPTAAPGTAVITWGSGYTGGNIPSTTPDGTTVGQLSPGTGNALRPWYAYWTNNFVIAVDNSTGVVTRKGTGITSAYTATFSVGNDANIVYTTATVTVAIPPCSNSLDFSQACNSSYLGAVL
jgi:hypothetical protein